MHELSITQRILEIVLNHAEKAGASQITDIYLVIGQLSTVVDDSVHFYWDIVSQDTIAVGANLHFRRIPTEFACLDCGLQYLPGTEDFACPACKSTKIKVIRGEEFYLDSIEIDT
jgi:hydrogenase nickel incorporation protein HypA/HybF